MPLDDEDSLLRGILALGPDYSPLLHHVQWEFLSPEAIDEFEGLTDESILKSILHRFSSDLVRRRQLHSVIIPNLPPILNQFQSNSFTLLWRGSRDGFGAEDFHDCCDNHPNTLTLVLDTKGNIFGGFTPLSWNPLAIPADRNRENFMFTLKNPQHLAPMKFPLKSRQRNQAITYIGSLGPVFGNGALCIADQCNRNSLSHTSTFGVTFTNPTKGNGATLFTGTAGFCVEEIEVFEVNP
jgi:hypothetical protein